MWKPLSTLIACAALAAFPAKAQPAAALKSECASCHALEKPAAPSVQRLWERKGPDLWYAGDKFNRDWLVAWLQHPTTIRPGGVFWRAYAVPGEPRDTLDASAQKPHPAVDAAKAAALADALMQLKSGQVTAGSFNGQGVNMQMGALAFSKLRGCASCHQDKPGSGGLSGPSLAEAGARLNPDFVFAYVKDPQAFDAHVWMPRTALSDQDLQRLTAYVASLGKDPKK